MKRNLILLIVLAALVGGAFLVQKNKEGRLNNARAGIKFRELLLPELPIKEIHKIRIHDGAGQTNLDMVNGKWVVAERNNYPASAEKVGRTLLTLSEIKIADGKHVVKDALGGRKLLAPSDGGQSFETGLQVELLNEKGDVLANIIAGEYMKSTGGANSNNFNGNIEQRFIRLPSMAADGDTAWLINDVFYDIQATPADWLDKGFLDVRKLKDIAITEPVLADSWGAQRKDENSEFTLTDPQKPGDELDTAKANGVTSLFSQATFTDVLAKDKIAPDLMKNPFSAKINTFEDFHYLIKVAEKKEPGATEPKYYLTSTVTADLPKERKAEPNEKPEDKKKKDDEFAAKKKELEDKLAKEKGFEGFTYEVSNYIVGAMVKKRSEVLRDRATEPKITLPGQSNSAPAPSLIPSPRPPVITAPAVPTPVPTAPPPAPPAPPAKATATTPPVSVTPPATPAPSPVKPAEPKPAPTPPPAPPVEPKPAPPAPPQSTATTPPVSAPPAPPAPAATPDKPAAPVDSPPKTEK